MRSTSIRSSALSLALWARRHVADRAGRRRAAPGDAGVPPALRRFVADSLDANTAAYSPDGDRVVDRRARMGVRAVWDVATQARRWRRLPPVTAPCSLPATRRAGDRIALGFADGTVLVDRPVAAPSHG